MASQCEALVIGKQKKMSVVMSFKRNPDPLLLPAPEKDDLNGLIVYEGDQGPQKVGWSDCLFLFSPIVLVTMHLGNVAMVVIYNTEWLGAIVYKTQLWPTRILLMNLMGLFAFPSVLVIFSFTQKIQSKSMFMFSLKFLSCWKPSLHSINAFYNLVISKDKIELEVPVFKQINTLQQSNRL